MALNKKHSNKDYTGLSLAHLPAEEFRGTTIRGTCFAQETPDTEVFPADAIGMGFVGCNLDNVMVPPWCTVTACCARRYRVQNDLEDWEIDGAEKPVRPLNPAVFERAGVSQDPKDIPEEPLAEPRTLTAVRALAVNT